MRGSGGRLIIVGLFLTLNFILTLSLVEGICYWCNNGDCNGNCEPEETNYCDDCSTRPNCGDGYCDLQNGENCNTCAKDCRGCNGASCTSGYNCDTGFCCGAPNGICVATIECQPGATQPCSTNPPKIRTCSNTCLWGSCTQTVACIQHSQCDDNNICTLDEGTGQPYAHAPRRAPPRGGRPPGGREGQTRVVRKVRAGATRIPSGVRKSLRPVAESCQAAAAGKRALR